jgi:hypothetical protein
MSRMTLRPAMFILALLPWAAHPQTPATNAPVYTAAGELLPPTQYREWIYLSTGMNMSYIKRMAGMSHDMFSNVFVNPEAYREFQRSGTWPDKTMLVLEVRGATNKGSINKQGFYQNSDIMGLEVHVKDTGPLHRGLLQLPQGPRGGGHDLRAVLSDGAGSGEEKRHAECAVRGRTGATRPLTRRS